jgi:hypothetical protein
MRIFLLLSLSLLGLMACNQAPEASQTQPKADTVKHINKKDKTVSAVRLIVPGKSIGNTLINENMKKVIRRIGRPEGGDAAMGKSLYVWRSKKNSSYVTMIFASRQMGAENEASLVKQIRVTSPWFVTQEGIHVGSSLTEISKYYKVKKTLSITNKGKAYTLFLATKLITFEIDEQHICKGIVVYNDSVEPGQTYLPFYDNQ